ncbi:tetratricopeptide repeat protein [Streptomyces sp. NPDC088789]|uniref:tetratricopeptide repeat protein n=1 Tax=Streptomyces sp. NPDC088789 TaxID=3365899 RepID=UPI003829510B
MAASDRTGDRETSAAVRLTGHASSGGSVVQAGRDVRITEVHHHVPVTDAVVLVERVQPTAEAVREVFVGRDDEVESVLAVLDPRHEATAMVVVSAVAGLAGIGKTALARVSAAEAVARGWFPGGAVFVDLNGYALQPEQWVQPHQMYGPLLHALDEGAADRVAPRHQAVQYHRLLDSLAAEGRSVLLVLDNASTSDQITDLLPRSRRHRVMITSRHTLTVRGSRTLDLRTLAGQDSLTLVRRQLEQLSAWDDRVHDDRESLLRLCRLCGHLPLALHIAAALLAGAPGLGPAELADELAQAHSRLDLLDDGERAVRAAFELSYHRLADEQARLFRLLPLNPGPHFGIESAAELLGYQRHRTRLLLHGLARAHMIEYVAPGAWRQHDLIRDYAMELMVSLQDDQLEPSERLLNHYAVKSLATAQVLREPQPPDDPRVQYALEWFDKELPNLQAAVGMGVTFDDVDGALRILHAVAQLHRHRGQSAELAETAARIAEVSSASNDVLSTPWALTGRAWELGARLSTYDASARAGELLSFSAEALRRALDHDRVAAHSRVVALWKTARSAAAELPEADQPAAVPLLHEIARTASLAKLGDFLVARPLELALACARHGGDDLLEAHTHLVKARHWVLRQRVVAALDRLDAALEPLLRTAESTDASRREHVCRLLTATAYDTAYTAVRIRDQLHSLDEHLERAARLALAAWGGLGAAERVAATLSHFAELHHNAGHLGDAVRLYGEAAAAYTELERPRDLARTLVNLSAAHTALGDHSAAVEAARRAVELFRRVRDLSAESLAGTLLAQALLALGDTPAAIAAAGRAEDAAVNANDGERQVSAAATLALTLKRSGLLGDAGRAAWRALQVAEHNGRTDLYDVTRARLQDDGLV